ISEDIARQDVRKYLDEMSRNPQSRLRTNVAVTKGNAFRFLQIQYPFERIPAEGLRKVMFGVSSNYKMDFKDLVIMLATPGADAYVPLIELEKPSPRMKPKFKADGLAVFHQGRMVGTLDNEQSEGVLWIRGEMKRETFTFNLPGHPGRLSCELLREHSDVKVSMKQGHPAIEVTVQPEGDISENDSDINLTDPKNVQLVEQAMSAETKKNIEHTLDLLQHKYDSDIVRFGDHVHHAFPKQWPALVKDWNTEFTNIPVSVNVEWKIRRIGMIGPSAAER
ncbi:MAG: Ger(x)C family spore germination protein, partial [Tumebacillaceae bacterium]